MPAFGEWGFALATRQPWQAPDRYPPALRFLTVETTAALFQFPPDMALVETEINRPNNQILVHYVRAGMESGDAVSLGLVQCSLFGSMMDLPAQIIPLLFDQAA